MPSLDTSTQRELLDLLAPLMAQERERSSLLMLALGQDAPVLRRIDLTGATEPFILKMVATLAEFGEIEPGKQALWALLEVTRERVGVDRQARIDALRLRVNVPSRPVAVPTRLRQTTSPLHLRVFLASPGDVVDERALALKVLEQLPYDPLLRDRITLEAVAWDKPGAGTPVLATMTPQEALAHGLRKPSACDIVIVILWSRMGTPLPADWLKPDGTRYLSGTEWEYVEALQAAEQHGQPEILVYRRTEKQLLDQDDPDFDEKRAQWQLVNTFFASFRNPDGSITRGYNSYGTPNEFRDQLDHHLRGVLSRLLASHHESMPIAELAPAIPKPSAPPLWQGSPFPGLFAFTSNDAPIFFGRGRETDGLIRKLADPANRFLAVVGASGSGKSSLVAAGLLPRLQDGAIEGSRDWIWVRFTPAELGDDPFIVLADRLVQRLERAGSKARDLAAKFRTEPAALIEVVQAMLEGRPTWAKLLLFIDQFEEVFTLVNPRHCGPFLDLLAAAAHIQRMRILVTLRADFYARCVESPMLAEWLRTGSYPLAAPGFSALFEMITGPAARAGLMFEEGLALRILEDTGTEPGALALMAFALSELYKARSAEGLLTHAAYESFNGVKGAIAKRAEDTFNALDPEVQAALTSVFQELVEADERGIATRQRALLRQVARSAAAAQLVEALTNARLLVSGADGEPMVEIAHEALLTGWPRLAAWIDETRESLRLLRQVRLAAAEWERQGRTDEYLWPYTRLTRVHAVIDRLGTELNETERRFVLLLDRDELLGELDNPTTTHQRRAAIGDCLGEIGDTRAGVGLRSDGLPDIVWCEVPGGEITMDGVRGSFRVAPFEIAKYHITWVQYRAFLDAPDGYQNPLWWRGLDHRDERPGEQLRCLDNHPAEHVSWYDAVAFCRWLSARLGEEIRLPTEWEWQQAATGGDPTKKYPWGEEWDPWSANTQESGLNRATAVGMYPHGASPIGALGLSGNVWEWCINEYAFPEKVELTGNDPRVVRGGSWSWTHDYAGAVYRDRDLPNLRSHNHGFRVARLSPTSNSTDHRLLRERQRGAQRE